MINISSALNNLNYSKFRSGFYLSRKDQEYVKDKGIDTIRIHTRNFIEKRLAPKVILNDGHQTPYHGHPTFVAQHATATCCRSCLYKWYKIPKNRELTKEEQDYVVDLIIAWINRQMLK